MGMWKIVPLLICIGCASSSKLPLKEIKELDDKNFKSFLKKSDLVIVKFYATWCRFSKELKKDYEEAAKTGVQGVIFAEVKCDDESTAKTCEDQKIEGYPTLSVYRKGEPSGYYSGNRKSDDIIKYMKRQKEMKGLPQNDSQGSLDFKHMCLLKDKPKWIEINKE